MVILIYVLVDSIVIASTYKYVENQLENIGKSRAVANSSTKIEELNHQFYDSNNNGLIDTITLNGVFNTSNMPAGDYCLIANFFTDLDLVKGGYQKQCDYNFTTHNLRKEKINFSIKLEDIYLYHSDSYKNDPLDRLGLGDQLGFNFTLYRKLMPDLYGKILLTACPWVEFCPTYIGDFGSVSLTNNKVYYKIREFYNIYYSSIKGQLFEKSSIFQLF